MWSLAINAADTTIVLGGQTSLAAAADQPSLEGLDCAFVALHLHVALQVGKKFAGVILGASAVELTLDLSDQARRRHGVALADLVRLDDDEPSALRIWRYLAPSRRRGKQQPQR